MKDRTATRTIVLAISAFLSFAFVAVYSFDVSLQFLLQAFGYCVLAIAIIAIPAALLAWIINYLR